MSTQFQFQTEVSQLLNIVVNSLYSNKEVFLRELISNSSDAIDKARVLSLTDKSVDEKQWEIRLNIDNDAKTLTITDNGIGMNLQDAKVALGTIAHSGTKAFMEKMAEGGDTENADLIGQFGVGFYASFMVADKVTVLSQRIPENGKISKAIKWESSLKEGAYSLVELDNPRTEGTEIILHLGDDNNEFLDAYTIKELVTRYSNFISYPIIMQEETVVPVDNTDADADTDTDTDTDGNNTEETTTEMKDVTLNSMQALWMKPKSEVTDEEYNQFYKQQTRDFLDPFKTIHYRAEGTNEFNAMLFIPSKVQLDIYYKDYKIGPTLYVRRVQIMENCEQLVPLHLRFVKGVVDSSDLPLNVSREILQSNKQVDMIRKSISKKILATLKSTLKNERDEYTKFYGEFGKVLKEGVHYDMERKEDVAALLLFESTATEPGNFTTLDEYIQRLPENENNIHYITGQSRSQLQESPYIEELQSKGLEVIFATDDIDDMILRTLGEFKGKQLLSASDATPKTTNDDDNKEQPNLSDDETNFVDFLKEALTDNVSDVIPSTRLRSYPSLLTNQGFAPDPHMQRILESMGQEYTPPKKGMEINMNHELVKKLQQLHAKDANSDDLKGYAQLLYDNAVVSEGGTLDNPGDYVKRVTNLMTKIL